MPVKVVRYLLSSLGCLLVAICLLPSFAHADGGKSIAAAPLVAYGQQEFGNTATGVLENADLCGPTYSSYWTLGVTAGDRITLDWEAQASATELRVYPVGTNDFNVSDAQDFDWQELADNGKNELVLTAPASGSRPMVFTAVGDGCTISNQTGPYDFTAYVRHLVRLALPRFTTLAHKTTLKIAVHNAEGGVITDPNLLVEVQMRTHRTWLSVGSATAMNSVATVPVRIPSRYQSATLRAVAHGGAYLSAATRSRTVVVLDRPKHHKRHTHRSKAR